MKNKLKELYGERVDCTFGNSGAAVQKSFNKTSDIVAYLNQRFQIAVIWNGRYHIERNGIATNCQLGMGWGDIRLPSSGMDCKYNYFKTLNGDYYQKILIVSFEILDKIKYDLMEYLKFDVDDPDLPTDLRLQKDKNLKDWTNENDRKRVSVTRYQRSHDFRARVLNNYGSRCAICNLSEERILEAAHIIPVAQGGQDNLENGICLCRNHHRMMDEHLITLNFENHTIENIADSVQNYIKQEHMFAIGQHEQVEQTEIGGNINE